MGDGRKNINKNASQACQLMFFTHIFTTTKINFGWLLGMFDNYWQVFAHFRLWKVICYKHAPKFLVQNNPYPYKMFQACVFQLCDPVICLLRDSETQRLRSCCLQPRIRQGCLSGSHWMFYPMVSWMWALPCSMCPAPIHDAWSSVHCWRN